MIKITKEEILNVFSNGTTFKELPTENLSNFKLPLPPENEQIKIVSKLLELTTTSNKIISLLQKKIVLLKSYRQSLISSVVTGKVRASEDKL